MEKENEEEIQKRAFLICSTLSIVEDNLNNDFAEHDIAERIRECRLEFEKNNLTLTTSLALDALLYGRGLK